MKIGVDVMGSDLGPKELLKSCLRFVNENDVQLVIYGNQEELDSIDHPRIIKIPTTYVLTMDDGPLAVKRHPNASMVKAITDCVAGENDAVVSAGSSGALLSCGVMISKMIPGIERPAFLAAIPNTIGTSTVLLDMGANSENSSDHLCQFAVLGHAFAQTTMNIEHPTIGLLNIGTEDKKGDLVHKDAVAKLRAMEKINFTGNIEGRDVLNGVVDVLVADGFSGNIALKTVEGTVLAFNQMIKEVIKTNRLTMIGGYLIKEELTKMKDKMNYQKYGGALLAGLNHVIIKAHGSSNEEAFYNAIRQAHKLVGGNVVDKIKRDLL
ncbi:MAG: phosphate acyltransferase [Firmicutes bacterium HGW-Firmicutes-19]|jgi:phosphate acyltransferase|nr:MAG: phosphate acyltransferase [Firmicutes bacterium HGW-Firmicutes-19]